jgi:CMP-N,N'-diacetyllegionaminic acid synthase
MKVICIIPARGGSKGVKRKNIKEVSGKPLIAYAIECAMQSKKVTYFTVSTEDDEIAEVASRWQSPVVKRPAELAADETPMLPVLLHALDYLETEYDFIFDLVILLQTTSPIRTASDVDDVITMFEEDPTLDGVISVVELNNMHLSKMYNVDEEGWMQPVADVSETGNRQELPPVYYRNGCIYAVRPEAMKKEKTIMVKNKKAYIMPAEWWANIDDEKDLVHTESLMQTWKENFKPHHNGAMLD